jgi:hypothetical protein
MEVLSSKYETPEDGEIVGVEHYKSRAEGVTVNLYRGFFQDLFIDPPASEEKLRCKPLNHSLSLDHTFQILRSILRSLRGM